LVHPFFRLQDEIDRHLYDQPFHFKDQNNLPYLRAFVDELQRVANVLPWTVPHSVSKEASFSYFLE